MYDNSAPKPKPAIVYEYNELDDFYLVPQDGMELFEHVDYSFHLDLKMDDLGDGAN